MKRGPRDLSLQFNWRAELASLAVGLGWIVGLLLLWRVALFVASI